jgi:phosphatidylserine decarboxylase
LHEAKETRFKSLHDCFTRELKLGVRPIDERPGVVVSPCDAVVGRFGGVQGVEVLQAKGYPYSLRDLLGDSGLVEKYRDGVYVTLRLKSNMYHRFHAPVSGEIRKVTYIAGDTWNVNPIALRRIESLFCKNERAVLEIDPRDASKPLLLVPVAAILVASMKFNFLPETLDLNYGGPTAIKCAHSFNKGDELGFFRQGSTIIVFGSAGYRIDPALREGQEIEVGRLLLYDDAFRAAFQGRSTGL